jgi:hypothetical protein
MSDNSKPSLTIWKRLVLPFVLWVASVPVFVAVDQNIPAVPRLIYASAGVAMLAVGVICQMRENSRQ